MYSTFGPLEECAKFHESFGFVRFLHAEDARQALDATHGITVKGRCIKVEFAATTTSWRSANNSHCNECRSTTRYNIPPIRAVDLLTHRGPCHSITNTSVSSLSPPPIGPIGNRRKHQSKSTMSESNLSINNSTETRQSHVSCSSPSSSYAASSSHIAEIDDYDYDLDSGYNDELDSPLLSSSTSLIPTSPWYDIPVTDEMFIWDFQLYADIARELPLVKSEHFSSELMVNDDTWKNIGHFIQLSLKEYL